VPLNLPNILTLLRLVLIPVLVAVYFLPHSWSNLVATIIFAVAASTDWLDGWLARKLNQQTPFGAFLDPVADKLMVTTALVLVATDPLIQQGAWVWELFVVAVAVIIGREIVISALREWMAELGKRASVAVSYIGKVKLTMQAIAIGFLLYRVPAWGLPTQRIGEVLLGIAAVLTLWSMWVYLRAAWPVLKGDE